MDIHSMDDDEFNWFTYEKDGISSYRRPCNVIFSIAAPHYDYAHVRHARAHAHFHLLSAIGANGISGTVHG